LIDTFLQEQKEVFTRNLINGHHSSLRNRESRKGTEFSERNYQVRRKEEDACIRIACHNINGIKQNKQKIDLLHEWIQEENIGICGIIETNIMSKEGRFLLNKESNYMSIWTNANPLKKKGSGIGLLVRRDWEKYIGNKCQISEYMLEVSLFFK
jgi:hypothetical protein